MAANQLLLVEDVEDLGRAGDLVKVRPGYARNYLLPRKKAVVATKGTLLWREKIKAERTQRAEQDRTVAEQVAERLRGHHFRIEVKVDPEGHMYGSVSALDIVNLLAEQGFSIEKKHVVLAHPIKELGSYEIVLRLQENVPASFQLDIDYEGSDIL